MRNYNSVHKNVMFYIKMQPPASSCTWRIQQLEIVTWHKVKGEKKVHDESLSYHRWSNRSTVYQTCLHTNMLTFKSGLQEPPVALVTIALPVALQPCPQDDKQPWHGLWSRRNELNKLQSPRLVLLPASKLSDTANQTQEAATPQHPLTYSYPNPLCDWIT